MRTSRVALRGSLTRRFARGSCNWSDNCGEVMRQCPGVVGLATPDGLTEERFAAGLKAYARAHRLRAARAERAAGEASLQ